MTNPHKGDVGLEVGGRSYTLRYSHLALVKLEKQLDRPMARLLRDFEDHQNMRIGTIVALLWAGLQKHHPEITFEAAADLLDDIEGGAVGAMNVMGEALHKAFNQAPGTKGTNPTMMGNGAGINSSSNTSASATFPTPSGKLPPEN